MDKSRDGERGEKSRGVPQGLDPTTAALYAPWLQQEQALLSNMFGAGGLGAYAAAAAMGGMGGLAIPPSFPPTSSSAGLASLAAAQQQQQAQAAALASLGPSAAAWWNLAGMQQQMELLARLQGAGMAGMSSGYHGIHPDHLMSLEILQAQHAAAMAAALASSNKSTGTSRTSSNSSSNSSNSAVQKHRSTPVPRPNNSTQRQRPPDPLAALREGVRDREKAKHEERNRHHGLNSDTPISVRADLGLPGSSSGLSYGIASLMADKPSPRINSRTPTESIRSKELEIIPLSASKSNDSSSSNGYGDSTLAAHLSSKSVFRSSKDSAANYSTLAGRNETKPSYSKLTNGVPLGGIPTPQISIEPLASNKSATDAPLNLSLKSSKQEVKNGKEETSNDSPELLNKLKSSMTPYEYSQNLGLGLMPDMAPGLDVLQSLYGGQAPPRDILASMQDALQRQLLMSDGKKRDDKRKRPRTNSLADEIPREDRARHLGRGVSKPKKNTVASLLEHCRAVGIKPQLPLPGNLADTPISSATTPVTTSPPCSAPPSPSIRDSVPPSPVPATPPHPPSLIPLFASALGSESPIPVSNTASQALSSLSSLLTSSTSSLSFPSLQDSSKDTINQVQITPVTSSLGGSESPLSQKKTLSQKLENRNHLEISDFSDSEISSDSSLDDYEGKSILSPWLKSDSQDRHDKRSGSPPHKKRKMITDESSLRLPLYHGWKRETAIRGIAQSGVRGEVVYYAPCGKAFKQYPDIIRYLERQNITEITRDNFSFSSKIPVGDYVDSTNQHRYSEGEIREIIATIKKNRGMKHSEEKRRNSEEKQNITDSEESSKSARDARDALEVEAEAILRRLEAEEKAEKAKQSLIHKIEEQSQMSDFLTKMTASVFRVWKEQEKMKKQEEVKKEKEGQKKQREEVNRQRLYDQLRKAQERDQEKQKQKLIKDQERERRRYHGVLVRSLEAKKRLEEKEKRREVIKEEKRAFKEKKREERQQARELNLLMKEVKEDMELTDHRALPNIPLMKGLKLPPEAFGCVLLIFEFLNNFGETLGFDMDSLPSLQSLQLALLGDHESEEELLNILTHLLVCAIEDPGVPNSQRNTTLLGQTLNKADITVTNVSEILRIYLYAHATLEVRTIHGLHGTEKERRESPPKAVEWEDRLIETNAYKMSTWLQKLPLTALTATQKGVIVAYVCNELLQNKAVLRQIEDSLDRHNGLKTHKWKLDARIRSLCRRLKMTMNRKRFNSQNAIEGQQDSNMSAPSNISFHDKDDEDDHADESGGESGMEEVHDEEEDTHLNLEEATKTLESLQKQMDAVRQELFETAQQVRSYNCGQDRYQRTLFILPHAGGPFLGGLSSCDYRGRDHFPLKIPDSVVKKGFTYKEVENLIEQQEIKLDMCENIKEEPKIKEEQHQEDFKEKDFKKFEDIRKKQELDEKPETEIKKEDVLSEVEKDLLATGLGLIPGQYLRPEHVAQFEKLSFSLLPRITCDPIASQDAEEKINSSLQSNSSTPLTSMTPLLQQSINSQSMSHEELLEKLHQTAQAVPIPPEYKSGWWHISSVEQLKDLMQSLNDRGARESELKRFLQKNFNIVKNAVAKQSEKANLLSDDVDPAVMNFDEIIDNEEVVVYDKFGVPVRDEHENWRLDVALKQDLLALDTVYALEEKITNASMQNKNWKASSEKYTDFLPSCLSDESLVETIDISAHQKEEGVQHEDWKVPMNSKNPIHVGRARLLYLEDGIERRYLKPPLGQAVKCSPGTLPIPKPENAEVKNEGITTKGLHHWHEAVLKCETAAQLAMCSYMLETAVAWDKSIMKAYCQFCHSGDFEEKLLLCDGCDKGYHMHCFKPPMDSIPEGDWFCYECVNKFSDSGHRHCLACGGVEGKNLLHCSACPRAYHTSCLQPPLTKIPRIKWHCPACSSKSPRPKKAKRKISESSPAATSPITTNMTPTNGSATGQSTPQTAATPEHCVEEPTNVSSPCNASNGPSLNDSAPATPKKDKVVKKKDLKELSTCRLILSDLENHDDSWPFMNPVNTRQFPTYKKIIKKPVDISTIRKKLEDSIYKSKEDYFEDMQLMFNNCEIFNEDDSPVGKAGHNLRTFFQNKWKENFGL